MFKTTALSAYLALAPFVWGQGPTAAQILLGAPSGSYLGVGVIDVNESAARRVGLANALGVEVANVAEGSPAEKAGIERGDVVVRFRGETVQGVEHFVRLVRETPVGREVDLELASAGGKRTAKAVIGERSPRLVRVPSPEVRMLFSEPMDVDIPRPTMLVNSRTLGATLESVNGQFAEVFGVTEGVLVREVDANGPAARAGVEAGDVITSIEGAAVVRTSDIRMELSRTSRERARMEVVRGKTRRNLEIETGRKTLSRPLEGARQVSRPN
jgi:serine protease Do